MDDRVDEWSTTLCKSHSQKNQCFLWIGSCMMVLHRGSLSGQAHHTLVATTGFSFTGWFQPLQTVSIVRSLLENLKFIIQPILTYLEGVAKKWCFHDFRQCIGQLCPRVYPPEGGVLGQHVLDRSSMQLCAEFSTLWWCCSRHQIIQWLAVHCSDGFR